jgi:hypothetical protein
VRVEPEIFRELSDCETPFTVTANCDNVGDPEPVDRLSEAASEIDRPFDATVIVVKDGPLTSPESAHRTSGPPHWKFGTSFMKPLWAFMLSTLVTV